MISVAREIMPKAREMLPKVRVIMHEVWETVLQTMVVEPQIF